MNTQTLPARLTNAANDSSINSAVYDVRISERQRYYLHLGLQALLQQQFVPGGVVYNEEDEFGNNIVCSLEDLFNPEGSVGPLHPTPTLNSLVV